MFGAFGFGEPFFAQGFAVVSVTPETGIHDLVEVQVSFHRTFEAALAYARTKELEGQFAQVVEASQVFGPRVIEVIATFTPGAHTETER